MLCTDAEYSVVPALSYINCTVLSAYGFSLGFQGIKIINFWRLIPQFLKDCSIFNPFNLFRSHPDFISPPIFRISLPSNYFLNCSRSDAVSKEYSVKALFGYFKMAKILFSFKTFQGRWLQVLLNWSLASLHSLWPKAFTEKSHTEGWDLVDHLKCFTAASDDFLFWLLHTNLPQHLK